MKKTIYIILLTFTLIGCGGGGGSGSNSPAPAPTLSGNFIDSAVEGLTYRTATQSGDTTSNGTFTYKSGETITFYLGEIKIGESSSKSIVSPMDLVSGGDINNPVVLNIARVLQTLDIDKTPSNGITLDPNILYFDTNLTVDFSSDTFITNLIIEINSTIAGYDLVEVNASTAQAHLEDTFYNDSTDGNDPLDTKQWYLSQLGIPAIHNDYNGSSASGSIIQIVDTGIDSAHEDLFINLDFSKSYNAETNTAENCTPDSGENHGTLCAGVASARGFNNKGIKGINPLGKVVGFKFNTVNALNFGYSEADLEEAWISGTGANNITVSSNSWGDCHSQTTFEEDIIKIGAAGGNGIAALRDGKGRIYVMAGGNSRGNCDSSCINGSSNLTYIANNQYVITVASIKENNTYSSFSSPGSNILISAYGTDIYTTDLDNTYSTFDGTSAATPMVAGGIGLILEACPDLGYRDVKYILANTADKVGSTNWVTNGAGLEHSIDYGYGRIDISAAIAMCKDSYTNLSAVSDESTEVSVNTAIPNNSSTGLTTTITVSESKTIEWVAVWFDADLDNGGEYEVYLESPAGTITQLLHSNNALAGGDMTSGDYQFRLSSVAFIDENSSGDWKVKVADRDVNDQTDDKRTIKKIKLQIVGH